MKDARTLHRDAVRANSMGAYRKAGLAVDRAIRLAEADGDAPLVARIRITKALTLLSLEGRGVALEELAAVRRIADDLNLEVLAAQCDLQESAVHVWCNEWPDVLVAIDRMRTVLTRLPPQERCSALINEGLALLSLGRLDAGRDRLEEARLLATTHELEHQRLKSMHNLAWLEYLSGNHPKALTLLREAREHAADVDQARVDLDLCQVLVDVGLLEEAERRLRSVLGLVSRRGQHLDRAEILLDLARITLVRGDLPEARRQALRAATAFERQGAARSRLLATSIIRLVDILRRTRLDPAPERSISSARAADPGRPIAGAKVADPDRHTPAAKQHGASESHRLTDPVDHLAARVGIEEALLRGDLVEAMNQLPRVDRTRGQGLGVRLHVHLLTARCAAAVGDLAKARREVRRGANLLAVMQGRSGSLDLRAGVAIHSRRLREFDLDLAERTGSEATVFATAERWRAASLRTDGVVDDEELLAPLLTELRQAKQELAATGSNPPQARARLDLRVRAVEDAVARRSLEVAAGASTRLRSISLTGATRVAARADTMICAFHRSGDDLIRMDIDRSGGVRTTRLGSAPSILALAQQVAHDVADLVHTRGNPRIAAQVQAGTTESVAALDQALLLDLPQTDVAVTIVPTLRLMSVPWRMLPTLADRALVVTPSITSWAARTCTGPESSSASTTAAITAAAARPTITTAVTALSGPQLAHSEDEVAAVVAAWAPGLGRTAGGAISGPATAAGLRHALTTSTVVHLSAHGQHDGENPMLSSVLLTDGSFIAHELPPSIATRHVVLAACTVGQSRVRPGDEPLGLAAALLARGALSVLAPVAQVPDDLAAEIMADYHRHLAAGDTAAKALKSATRGNLLAQSFCLYGNDWSARELVRPGTGR